MRLFVAVLPPEPVRGALGSLARPPLARGRWTTADQWHVTLRFLGEVPEPEPVVGALAAAGLPSARAVVGPRATRLGREVVCLPVAGLDALAAAVVGATAGFGRPPEPRRYRGHLTLARVRAGDAMDLAGLVLEAGFEVREVVVVRSELRAEGARHHLVGRVACGP